MASKRLFLSFALGASLCALVSSFAAPLQSAGGSAQQTIVVQQVDLAGFQKLLQRNPKDSRPLLVNFWATWCDPCRDEFPDLVKIDQDYRVKGLDFIAVSLDDPPDIKTEVPKFLQQMHATMPVYLLAADPEPAINLVDPKWGGALPATFLYDKDGKVVFKHFGRIQTADLRAAIEKLVGSKQ
jgi:thiol-disulfide isomerase/thioredoxin